MHIAGWLLMLLLVLLSTSNEGLAQFSSGSTGADGPFAPPSFLPPGTVISGSTYTVPLPATGVFNFTTVSIPSGTTVTFKPNLANTPVILLATGDVSISGILDLRGTSPTGGTAPPAGGPGGFQGGIGFGTVTGGAGPGGGAAGNAGNPNATYGAPDTFVSLVPLFGGSGGGGGVGGSPTSGPGGGGGGGAILIASSTKIAISGTLTADGGFGSITGPFPSGGGSGGAIRLIAPDVGGTGSVSALGGRRGFDNLPAGSGRVRVERTTGSFTFSTSPLASISATLGPVVAPTGFPSIAITAVGGIAAPTALNAAYSAADVSLQQGTTNPITVTLTATNLPFPTNFSVQVVPQLGGRSTVNGTFSGPIASVIVNLPIGEVTQLVAFASFNAPTQMAALFPLIDGEPVDRVLIAAAYGEASRITLTTRSGKMVSFP